MRIKAVQIRDWGPFKGHHSFTFPEAPGLYFLWGRNEAEPRLGSNGAGKTRLFEAICWCLFGKTSKGLKAGDVANWAVGKKASVTLEVVLPDGELPVFIERTWSPNSWVMKDLFGAIVDLTKDETNVVLRGLRMSFESFLHAGMILKSPQRPMFLDLKPEKKAELFSEVMGLDRWLDRAKKASTKASEEDQACREIEQSLARIEGSIEQLERAHDDEGDSEVWEAERRAGRDQLREDHHRELERHDGLKRAIAEAKERLEKLPGTGSLEQALEHARDDVADLQRVLNRLLIDGEKLQEKADEWQKHCDMLDELEESDCPTCGQLLTGAHLEREWLKALKRVEEMRGEAQAILAKKNAVDADLTRAKATLAEIEADWDYADKDRRELERLISDLRHDLTRCNQKLDSIEDEDEKLAARQNPYKARSAERFIRLENLKRQHRKLRRQLDDKLSRWRIFTHWAKWFKEIRLEQIGEALAQLEIEVNSQVVALGLVNWSISFAVDRETGSGSVQRGFNVTVTSPHNPKPVPWEAWCGGESQRLRIAAQCGLSNLIRSQTGSDLNLECWDEPTDALSAQGIQDLLIALAERAESEQRQIWVIDHHSLQFGGFTGQAGVIKTREGSSFDTSALYI